jgi:hypothetical protein
MYFFVIQLAKLRTVELLVPKKKDFFQSLLRTRIQGTVSKMVGERGSKEYFLEPKGKISVFASRADKGDSVFVLCRNKGNLFSEEVGVHPVHAVVVLPQEQGQLYIGTQPLSFY